MQLWAILLAAGCGSRMAEHCSGIPKQFLPFRGFPLFWHSAVTFARLPDVRGIVFVFPSGPFPAAFLNARDSSEHIADYESLLDKLDRKSRLGLPWRITAGGERRQDSVANGLSALPGGCNAVLVHDSARPFASALLMAAVIKGLKEGHGAVIPAIPVADTIKIVNEQGMALQTLDRSTLRAVQTPQGFALPLLRRAHAAALEKGWTATDDASLLERCGHSVRTVPGEERNQKITTPADLSLLEQENMQTCSDRIPCSGFGYDAHRYGGDRPFILGGVPIRCDVRISAHSDGDTLLHALMDALLGCIGGGDIGLLFPDDDPALDNVSSGVLLAEVLERCRKAGLIITHVDITIVAQIPRISPHRQAIAANLVKLLNLPPHAVNVKATTEEGLGFTGEKKGIKVMALASGFRTLPAKEQHP